MGEVMEIHVISKRKSLLSKVLNFLSLSIKGKILDSTIEVMDNWKYENVVKVNDIESAEQYIDDKIICITEKISFGVRGISVERIEGEYNYCIWYNPKNDATDKEYSDFARVFIEYFFGNMMKDDIKICAIGKETLFQYEENMYQTVSASHNIDIWLVDKKIYVEDCFKQYKICDVANYHFSVQKAVIMY